MNWEYTKFAIALKFYNGKAGAINESGAYNVYGSNGIIGYCEKYLFEDAIVIGRVGAYCGAIQYCKGKFWASDNTIVVKANAGYDVVFLSYLLRVINLNQFAGGSAQPLLTHGWIKPISVKMPPFSIQQKIAAILSSYDDLIENNLKRIKLLEEMAQITYEEWFVRLRFPGHESTLISPATGLPKGWSKAQLQDILILQRGFDLPNQHRVIGSVPVYSSTGVSGYHNQFKVRAPGVLTGRSGTLGHVMYANVDYWPLNTTLWIKEYKDISPIFAYYILKSLKLEKYNSGVAVPTLNRNDAHLISVFKPPKNIVDSFTSHISPIFAVVDKLNQQNQLLREARDILLPRLTTGKIDVESYNPADLLKEVA